jgi:serine/threonine protein kinase
LSDDVTPSGADTGVGTKIAGYLLEEQIGRGGMAVVFRAHDERLDRRVALKLLAPGLAADTAFRLRFIRESRAAAAVDHPNIIPVYDAGDAGGSLFIAMRYVQGGDAKSALRQAGTLPPARAWAIITQVAAALDAAHARGLVHRDVKPANMLLDATAATGTEHGILPGGQAEHVYLSDFGISKQSLSSNLTSTGQFVGTLDYVAPEQIEGRETDGRADQYSLACAAYELISGVPPFRRDQGLALLYAQLSEPPPAISASRPGLPPAVDQVLATALAKTPGGRYPSCSQFAIELGRALNLIPGQPGTPGMPDLPSTAGHLKPWPATELARPASGHDTPAPSGPAPGGPAPGGSMAGLPPAVLGTEEPTRRPPGVPDEPTMLSGASDFAGSQGSGQPAPAGTPAWQAGPADAPGAGGWQSGSPGTAGTPAWQGGSAGTAGTPAWQGGSAGTAGAPAWQGSSPGTAGAPAWQAGAPAGPTAPGWAGAPGQPPGKRRRSGAVLAGAVIALIVVAGGAVAVIKLHPHSGPTTSPPTSPTAPANSSSSPPAQSAAEAATVNNLLTSSAASRMPLQSAVTDVMNCTNLAGAVAQIQQVVNQRNDEYNNASNLSTQALPNGVTLKSDLMLALLNSLDADKDYLAWAQHEENVACPSQSSAYNDALNADGTASQAKQAFVGEWNPIARTYGYQQQSEGTI